MQDGIFLNIDELCFMFIIYKKVPAARVLSSPSGEAAEDNVEERENSEVTQFFVTGYGRTDGRTYGRTDVRTYGQRDVEVEILF